MPTRSWKSTASMRDREMDYLVWTMLSFLKKFNNDPLGLNPVVFFLQNLLWTTVYVMKILYWLKIAI